MLFAVLVLFAGVLASRALCPRDIVDEVVGIGEGFAVNHLVTEALLVTLRSLDIFEMLRESILIPLVHLPPSSTVCMQPHSLLSGNVKTTLRPADSDSGAALGRE